MDESSQQPLKAGWRRSRRTSEPQRSWPEALKIPIRRCLSNRISERSHTHFFSRDSHAARGDRSFVMDYAKPADVVTSMIDASVKKLALAPRDLLIRGALSGALLGAATALAFTGALTTGQPLVGALIFPVSLVMIVLLGLELVTGSFALLPLARLEGRATWNAIIANWSWVFLANLLGSIAFGILIAISLTNMGKVEPTGVAAR